MSVSYNPWIEDDIHVKDTIQNLPHVFIYAE